MLSKIAERVYWTARYIERIENSARLIKVHSNLIYDLPKEVKLNWYTLIEIFNLEEHFTNNKTEAQCMDYLLLDDTHPNSMISMLKMVRENLRTTRDSLPKEAWLIINELYLDFKQRQSDCLVRAKRNDLMSEIIASCQQVNGMFSSGLSRNLSYKFITLGRNLERADMSTRLLDEGGLYLQYSSSDAIWVKYHQSVWTNLIRAIGGFFMYRQHVQTNIDGQSVINFILKDPHFPKSIYFCWKQVTSVLKSFDKEMKEFIKLDAKIKKLMRNKLSLEPNSTDLRDLVNQIQIQIASCNDLCYKHLFNPTVVKMQSLEQNPVHNQFHKQ